MQISHIIKQKTLSGKIIFSFLLFVLPLLTILQIIVYINMGKILEENYNIQTTLIEKNIVDTIKNVNNSYKMLEKSLTKQHQIEKLFGIFAKAYDDSDRNPEKMNLEILKQEFGKNIDLYIINNDCIIEYTTFPTVQGLDFKRNPNTYKKLTAIRQENSIVIDRISPEILTGRLRLWAYQPSADKKYLFEIGISSDEFAESISHVNLFNTAETMKKDYPLLKSITIFDSYGYMLGNLDYKPQPKIVDNINKAKEKGFFEYYDAETSAWRKYIYIQLSEPEIPANVDKVVELIYDKDYLVRQLQLEMISHIVLIIVGVIICVIGTFMLTKKLMIPIHKLTDNAKLIASGNYNVREDIHTGDELELLGKSFNQMVEKLHEKTQMLEIINNNLEQLVSERTQELEQEIAERKKTQKLLEEMVTHDHLTGLSNRKFFQEQLYNLLECATGQDGMIAVLFIDLDGFKAINDSYGHDSGDIVLKSVAERLLTIVTKDGEVSRLGGDEFTVILKDIYKIAKIDAICRRIIDEVRNPIVLGENQGYVTASIGVSIFPNDGSDMEELIKKADDAMYVAKKSGKNKVVFSSS